MISSDFFKIIYDNIYYFVFFFIIFNLLIFFLLQKKNDHIITNAKIIAKEALLYGTSSIPLVGRADLIYKNHQDELIVLDIKKRRYPVVYESDKVQVSSYVQILSSQIEQWDAKRVRNEAYILFLCQKKKFLKKIKVYGKQELKKKIDEYNITLKSSSIPSPEKSAFCKICFYNQKCFKI